MKGSMKLGPKMNALALALSVCAVGSVVARAEQVRPATSGRSPGALTTSIQSAETAAGTPALKKYLAGLRERVGTGGGDAARAALVREADVAIRVAGEVAARTGAYPLEAAPLAYYSVPALSNVKRLPDVYPSDGRLCGPLRIVAAQGEFEPASFVVFPFADAARAELKASALSGPGGTIPAHCVDLKVVKCWYQAGTAWHSYFADPAGKELVPELLLNDELLVKVDHDTKDNYLRIDYPTGSTYFWVSSPDGKRLGVEFNHATEPVSDAKSLAPFALKAGEFKQFWVTVEIPRDAKEGIYAGTIGVSLDGKPVADIPLAVRVLPFVLPAPKTYYDLGREFYTLMYNRISLGRHMAMNGGDREAARRKLLAEYVDMRKHNVLHPLLEGTEPDALLATTLETYREAGLDTGTLFDFLNAWAFNGGVWGRLPGVADQRTTPGFQSYMRQVDSRVALARRVLGHAPQIVAFGFDECGRPGLINQRDTWRYCADKGVKTYNSGHSAHTVFALYNEDFHNAGGFMNLAEPDKWHAVGGRILNYAGPHTGPENPDYARRAHGLALYKAKYDGTGNYIYYEGSPNIWNDAEQDTFRCFNVAYPTKEGVIDTIQWEGFREAIDDVRYATKLKQLAAELIATGETDKVYAAKKALQWLEYLDGATADLDAARLEMVNQILQLSALL